MSIKSKIKENIVYFIYKIKDFMQEKKIKNPQGGAEKVRKMN